MRRFLRETEKRIREKEFGRKSLAMMLVFALVFSVMPADVMSAASVSGNGVLENEAYGNSDMENGVSENGIKADESSLTPEKSVSDGEAALSVSKLPERLAEGGDNTNLTNFITGASLSGEDITVEEDGVWKTVKPGVTYNMSLSFKENSALQFVDDSTQMSYTLPEGVVASGGGMINIRVTIDGTTYVVKDNVFSVSDDGKTLSLILNEGDPAMEQLRSAANAQFYLNFDASFTLAGGNQPLDFGNNVVKEVVVDDSHNASVKKWGRFDNTDNKMHYTVMVSSDGISENISVTDTILTDAAGKRALKLDTDSITVKSSDNRPVEYSCPESDRSEDGFHMTIVSLGHKQDAYIEYTASVDPDQVGTDGKITAQGNAVEINCDGDTDTSDDDDKKTYTSDVTLTSIQGKSGTAVAGEDGYAEITDNQAKIVWTLRLNEERMIWAEPTLRIHWRTGRHIPAMV